MYKNNILCEFGCPNSEDQYHIFKICKPIQDKLNIRNNIYYMNIYSDLYLQIEAVKVFIEIDMIRKSLLENLSPGGEIRQDPRT